MSDNTGKIKIKDVAKAVARSSSDSIEQIKLIQGGLGDRLTDIRKLESELVSRARAESEKAQQRELAELHVREQEQKAEQTRPAASEVKVAKAVIKKEQPEIVAQQQQQPETEKPVEQPAPREVEKPEVEIKAEAAEQQPVEEKTAKQLEPVQVTEVEKKEEQPAEALAEKVEAKAEKPRIAKPEPTQAAKPEQERPKKQPTGFIRPAERIARRGGALRDDAALRNASRPAAPREDRRNERPQRQQPGSRGGYSSDRPQQQQRSAGSVERPQRKPVAGGGRPPAGGGGRPRPVAASAQPQQFEKGKVSNYDPNKSNYIRVFDNDKRGKSRKQQEKERRAQLMNLDEEVMRGRKPKRKQQQAPKPEPVVIEKALITTDTVTVKTLSEKIGKPASEIIKRLLLLGTIAAINNEIDFDTAELVANELGVELEHKVEQTAEEIVTEDVADADEDMVKRPPVITIMGHVDHGKTSLLDKIRSSRVTAGEAGGITQHIGAYSVDAEGRTITFLDTPGHEAFTAMRARGAQVTDVVVLVVAADDGIMPQTVEAINHAKASGVPIIVAINKIDLPNANVDRVRQELTEKGLVWEEWGGDTVIVPVSAHTGEGIDQLLEMILLVSDMQELKANPNRKAKGTIVEARLDKGRGPVATVLVQNGTLHVGDTVVAGTSTGRIRGMLNDLGENVKEAYPSQPVEILGLGEVPEAGDTLYATEAGSLSRAVAEERKNRIKAERVKAMTKVSLDDLFSQISEGNIKELNVIVKADVQGSVEAVTQSLEKLSNDQVRVKVIHGAVGAIANSDILLASTSNAIIIGFNVRPDATARVAAEKEHIDVRLYRIIYDAIEDIEKAMKGLLDPVFEEVILGHAEVRDTFRVSAIGTIAGCYVQDGKINRNNGVRLLRDNVVIYEGKLDSLRRFKDDVKEVASGYECGMGLHNFNDIKEGDIIEAFMEQEVEQ